MIRFRSKLLQLGLNTFSKYGQYELSILKKPILKHQITSTNPLARKSFQEISRIIATTNPQNQIVICGFALSALQAHLAKNKSRIGEFAPKENKIKQEIINTCIQKMFSNLDKITPQELSILIQFMIFMYQIRIIKIKQQNLIVYTKQIPQLIKVHLQRDQQQGKYVQNFKKIFYCMLKAGKRYNVLKTLFEYLIKHDLKTNQECLKFFNNIALVHNYGFYDNLVETVLVNYINAKENTLENYRQWSKPVLGDIIKNFCHRSQVQNSQYGKKYLAALLKQAQEENIQINQRIQLFCRLVDWCIQFNAQPLKIQQHMHFITIVYKLSTQIKKQLEKIDRIQFSAFKKIQKISFLFEQIAKKNHRFLGKTQKQLLKQFIELYEEIVRKAFLSNIKNLQSGQIVSVLKNRLIINQSLQNQLIEGFFEYLDKYSNKQYLISRIRMPQYITKEIMLTGSEKHKQKLAQFIKKVQKQFGSLREFQILRINNIIKILKLESAVFDEYIKHKSDEKEQNEQQIIENISRTNLREFGIDIMLAQISKLIQRYRKIENTQKLQYQKKSIPKKIHYQLIKCIWYSFKKFQFQTSADNINPLFQFWFSKNYDVIKSVFKNINNFESFMITANKQMTIYNNQIPCSINYEVVLEVFKACTDNFDIFKESEYQILIIDSLKNICETSNIFLLSSKKSRHSYFMKILWAQNILSQYFNKNKWNYKSKRQIQYLGLLLKQSKTSLYRERPSISNSILLQTLNQFNFYHEIRMKHFENYLQFWLWLRKNNIYHQTIKCDKTWVIQPVSQTFKQYFGIVYTFEYLLSINKIQQSIGEPQLTRYLKQSNLPAQFLIGTLTKDTVLDQKNLLDLLPTSLTLAFLCKRFPNIADVLVQKIMGIKDFLLNQKLVEAANLVHELSGVVSGSTQLAFDNWIKNKIFSLGSPIDNPSLIQLYIQFNIFPQEHRNLVIDYVKKQLKENNYFLAHTVYLNGFTGLVKQVRQLIHIFRINKVDEFMKDMYKKQLVNIVQHFLGLCLIQNQVTLIQQLIGLYIKSQAQQKILVENSTPDTFILLEVAKLRLKQSEKQYKILEQLTANLEKINPQIKQKTLQKINAYNNEILNKFEIKLETDPSSLLPKFGQKLVYVDYNQPGKNSIILQYLQKCLNIKNAALVKVQQLRK